MSVTSSSTPMPELSSSKKDVRDLAKPAVPPQHDVTMQQPGHTAWPPSKANPQSTGNTFTYNGHTLTWEAHGAGEHTFVLISGFSAVRVSWTPTIELLQDKGRCITIDLPGHYPASAPPDYHQITQETLIDLETRAIQHICGDGPITLIGHSTGGLVAIGVAARLPNQVKRVVTIGGVVWGELTGIISVGQWLLRHNLYPLFWVIWKFTQLNIWTVMFGLMLYVHRRRAHWRNKLAWSVTSGSYRYYKQHSLANLAILLRMLENQATCDIRAISQTLRMPLLAIVGSDDPVVPVKQSLWLHEHVPSADLAVIDGVGHTPFIEDPDTYQDIILAWLQAHAVE